MNIHSHGTSTSRSTRNVAHETRDYVVDLAPRWSILMPILLSAIEHGTPTGRGNAQRRLRELGNKVDSMYSLQSRMRATLNHLIAVWPQTADAPAEVLAVLAEALELLAISRPDVVPIRRP